MGGCASVLSRKVHTGQDTELNFDNVVVRNRSISITSETSMKEGTSKRGLTQNVIKEFKDQDFFSVYDVDETAVLGHGISGKVKVCTHKLTKIQYALKTLNKKGLSQEQIAHLKEEVYCLSGLDHPNIIRIHEVFEADESIYLVMELCKGGHLLDRLFRQQGQYYRENVACKYIQTIISAVAYCHANNVVHRDMKLENIMFEKEGRNSDLKIIDFGLSQFFSPKQAKMSHYVGTSYYVAPEVIDGQYDSKCDIWSVGVLCYILLTGTPPFYGKNDEETVAAVRRGKWQFDEYLFKNVSNEARDFISKCLTRRPAYRPTAAQLVKHPWFKLLTKTKLVSFNVGGAVQGSTDRNSLPDLHIIHRFSTFIERSTLSRIFMDVVAHTLLPEQIADLREQFAKFDVSMTGEISTEDLRNILTQFQGFQEEFIALIVSHLNINQTGKISYHEFLAATISRQHIAEENLQLAFEKLSNRKSHITVPAIRELLGETNFDVDGIMKEVGLDKDSKIGFSQFKAIMYGYEQTHASATNLDELVSSASEDGKSEKGSDKGSGRHSDGAGTHAASSNSLSFPAEKKSDDERKASRDSGEKSGSHSIRLSPAILLGSAAADGSNAVPQLSMASTATTSEHPASVSPVPMQTVSPRRDLQGSDLLDQSANLASKLSHKHHSSNKINNNNFSASPRADEAGSKRQLIHHSVKVSSSTNNTEVI